MNHLALYTDKHWTQIWPPFTLFIFQHRSTYCPTVFGGTFATTRPSVELCFPTGLKWRNKKRSDTRLLFAWHMWWVSSFNGRCSIVTHKKIIAGKRWIIFCNIIKQNAILWVKETKKQSEKTQRWTFAFRVVFTQSIRVSHSDLRVYYCTVLRIV